MKIRFASPFVFILALLVSPLHAVDNAWNGSVNTDWNTPANWSVGTVPTAADNAKVNITPGNIATITANVPNVNDLDIAQGGGTNGRLDHTAGSISVNGWSFVGRNGGTGVYNLANTATTGGTYTNYGTGSGSFTSARLYVGLDGSGSNGTTNINTSGTVSLSSDLNVGLGGNIGTVNFDAGTINRTGGWTVVGIDNGSTGTFRMSGGTYTGSGDTFIGINGGTGTLVKSGGDFTAANYLGFGRSGGNGTGTITGSGTISANRIYVGGVRDEGGTGIGVGSMTINTTGTITSSSDFSVGTNSGNGTVTMTAGTLNANSWMIIGETQGGKGGSTGTFIQNGGTVNVAATDTNARFWLGSNEGGSTGAASSGTYTMNAGTLNAKNTIIGKNYTGTINQNGGTVNLNQGTDVNATDHRMGEATGSTGNYNLNNGTLAVTGNFQIGGSGTGNFTQSGGSATFTNYPVVGRYLGGTGTLIVSGGSFSQTDTGTNLIIGEEGTGTLTVSGTGSVVSNGGIKVGLLGTGNGTINLNGGTVTAPSISKGTGAAQLNFNGGTFKAQSTQTEIFQGFDASNTQIQSDGLKIDSNGADIATGLAFDGTGSLTKQGNGSLTLNGITTHTGGTSVMGGTLILSATGGIGGTGAIDIAAGATMDASASSFSLLAGQTLTGNGTFAGTFSVGTGTLAPGNSIGTLSFTNNVVLGASSISNFEIQKIGLALTSDLATTTGSLALGGTLNVSSLGGTFTNGDTWNLLDAASISGTFSNVNLPSVSGTDYWDTSKLAVNGTITFVPEPGVTLLGLFSLGLLARRRRS